MWLEPMPNGGIITRVLPGDYSQVLQARGDADGEQERCVQSLVHVGLNEPMVVTLSAAKSPGTMAGCFAPLSMTKPGVI